MRDYLDGAAYLRRGWRLVRQRPRLLLLGMAPAMIVFLALAGAFVTLLLNLGDVAGWMTPFADDWASAVREPVRWFVGLTLVLGLFILSTATFTGITLAVGSPFYERIWRATEDLLGPVKLGEGLGFWESFRDGLKLTLVGLGISALVLVSGFIPVVGPVLAVTLGVVLSGRMLARDLVEDPLAARGFDKPSQKLLLAEHRRVVHGFGMATQACFLVPFGGVLMMPVAVAGATALVRDLLPDERGPAYQQLTQAT